ncbi:Dihydrofolate synthase/folylpolyglutamate synthase [Desulfonema limicola]|uniref:Dihydrofolate synthase/folylpolyglutamate synthase n=1 Tax=Desulfonema limicola TaxID=45656 RepID=A0A975BCR1_9BACT|nr:folylpolyglutamate synthase/dihydrofolate synthase family protein [Desulfonema limicola]QTA82895.1 Dihydrofolate synthase/folylpolyglutamate synthase [Desulfonema limicola]
MTSKKYYKECLETMFGLHRFGIKLGLETIGNILSSIGNPHKKLKTIHIAGTNGKGSVASALSTILSLAGYKTGLYTSPHLVHFNERICINNIPVSDDDIVEAYDAVKNVPDGEREPTFFEAATAMAFYTFAKHNVQWAVIETGMGGRLDATNIISPNLSIITNISLEHQEYLGDTIAMIAREKGGIIKQGIPVITGDKQEDVISILKDIAGRLNAPFYSIGNDFNIDDKFTYSGINNTWDNIKTGLAGKHQIENAALVLAACEVLNLKDTAIDHEKIRQGLIDNHWPGRLEIVSRSPLVIIDGAHNLAAAKKLGIYLSEELQNFEITLIIGILADKPYKDILQYLLPACKKVILTQPKTGRAIPVETLYPAAKAIIDNIDIIPDVDKAVIHAVIHASPKEAICIAGSLYVAGEAKEIIEKKRELFN